MPTFRHVPTGKRFFFVHIPRTAGRFVEANLIQNNNFVWDDDVEIEEEYVGGAATSYYNSPWYDIEVDGIQLVHFHRELYNKYMDKDIPHVAIVRHPVDRFISGSFLVRRLHGTNLEVLNQALPLNITTQPWFLNEFSYCNWHRPQVDFLTAKTYVWKFERGIGDNFFKWLGEIVGVDLQYTNDVRYHCDPDESNKMMLTDSMIHNLMDYYKFDIEMFNGHV